MSNDIMKRGVYGFFIDNQPLYVGSSACRLDNLERNHRNWREKYGLQGRTHFRQYLDDHAGAGEFRWLITPKERSRMEIETLEGQLIRGLQTPLNIDKDPVKSSIRYGRINEEE